MIRFNPKMLILPFRRKGGDAGQDALILGVTFATIAAVSDGLYAVAAGKTGVWMTRSRIRVVEIMSGLFLTAGGAWMAQRGR